MIFKIFKVICGGLVVALSVGCAGIRPPADAASAQTSTLTSAEKVVMLRAQERWDALMQGELNKASPTLAQRDGRNYRRKTSGRESTP